MLHAPPEMQTKITRNRCMSPVAPSGVPALGGLLLPLTKLPGSALPLSASGVASEA